MLTYADVCSSIPAEGAQATNLLHMRPHTATLLLYVYPPSAIHRGCARILLHMRPHLLQYIRLYMCPHFILLYIEGAQQITG